MREKLIELLDDALLSVSWDSHDYPDTESATDILIANDVVPVVRCKDCKHHEHYDALLYCGHVRGLAGSVAPDDFCSYGERKEENEGHS